jgi:ubiquinone/menaquinone biosynthesis C-methylase UbiE
MKVKTFKETLPPGFSDPTALPENEVQQDTWQKRNQNWWQSHPMRYDFSDALASQEFSPEFYTEIDRRFFESAWHYAPWKQIPFDSLIDFPALRNKAVLEIGCGNGSHAQLLATHAGSYTGIDLTDYAVRSTTTRLSLRGIGATVLQMDAEKMKFPDNSFDFIWSWGVIHHSANTAAIISEMRRVLRPGGRATIMVYHRGLWNFYMGGAAVTVLRGAWPTPRAIHASMQLTTDGALARYYSPGDWRRLVGEELQIEDIRILGQKDILVFLPRGRVKNTVLRLLPDPAARFLSTQCHMGAFLVADMAKAS